MAGQLRSEEICCGVSLRNAGLASSCGQMTVCRRPDCDRATAERTFGFCAEDHAAYVRSRHGYASLASAAQVVHASAFALVPVSQRQILAEYLVAVASEGLSSMPTDIPRSAVLLAAALLARGRVDPRMIHARLSRHPRTSRDACLATVGGSAR